MKLSNAKQVFHSDMDEETLLKHLADFKEGVISELTKRIKPEMQMLTSSETAELLGISTNTLGRWSRPEVGLPVYKINGCNYFKLHEVEAFIESKRKFQSKRRMS